MSRYDDALKIALVAALVAVCTVSALHPAWTLGAQVVTGIFALLNFTTKNPAPKPVTMADIINQAAVEAANKEK